jgi:hypothetical protein
VPLLPCLLSPLRQPHEAAEVRAADARLYPHSHPFSAASRPAAPFPNDDSHRDAYAAAAPRWGDRSRDDTSGGSSGTAPYGSAAHGGVPAPVMAHQPVGHGRLAEAHQYNAHSGHAQRHINNAVLPGFLEFRLFDGDADGRLDSAELEQACGLLRSGYDVGDLRPAVALVHDQDGSGALSEVEWRGFVVESVSELE